MIQTNSPAVLHLNKLSVLLICSVLFLFWINLEPTKTTAQFTKKNQENLDHSKGSKYLTSTSTNPFMSSYNEELSNDLYPRVSAIQSKIPSFSSLKVRLHGIVYFSTQQSYAMISVNGAIQEIISLNGEIAEGLRLTHIAKKQVEVDYFGEKHTLLIEKNQQNRILKGNSSITPSKAIAQDSFQQHIDFLEVDKQRNPIRLFMIRRPYAVYDKGEFQGYKIMPGSNGDQFKRLGFKSGDIITYLNGIEFTGPGKREFVIQELTHAMHIDLIVMRDKQALSIHYGF